VPDRPGHTRPKPYAKPHIGDPVPPAPVAEQDAAAGHHVRVYVLTALARPEQVLRGVAEVAALADDRDHRRRACAVAAAIAARISTTASRTCS
jgi:hypothetical protein